MRWTQRQAQAISARGGNLLVSAAAGSGKTAVLIERLIALVREGGSIDRMLVVTFTKAAAGEMREKALKAFSMIADAGGKEGARFARQAALLGRASISTLHSFCVQVLRTHFQAAGLDPASRVLQPAQAQTLRDEALEEALDRCYAKGSQAFLALDAALGEEKLTQMAITLYDFLLTLPDPWPWLDQALAAYALAPEALVQSPWLAALMTDWEGKLALAADWIEEGLSACLAPGGSVRHGETLEGDLAQLQALMAAGTKGYECLRQGLMSFTFAKLKTKERDADPVATEKSAGARDKAKKLIKALTEEAQTSEIEGLWEDLSRQHLQFQGLAELVHMLDSCYARAKRQQSALDFADLEHFTLGAVRQEAVAQALRAQYDHVFVDEYQDSSDIQEAILDCVCRGNNLFMVGDVKQSIYSFRQAKPALFLDKYARYHPQEGAAERKIDLNQNFRSRPEVLEAVNFVFTHAMQPDITDITYDQEAMLYPGLARQGEEQPVEVYLPFDAQDPTAEEEEERGEETPEQADTLKAAQALAQEAQQCALRIGELVGTPVYDARRGLYRPLQYRDMVILMRSVAGQAYRVERALQQAGIPVYSDIGGDYFELPEVRMAMALLKLIDNPLQDEALLAALRGPAVALSDPELAAIRLVTPTGAYHQAVESYRAKGDALATKLNTFYDQLANWRLRVRFLPLEQVIAQVCEESGLSARAGALPGGRERQANLRLMAVRAASMATSGRTGLHAFLGEARKLTLLGDRGSAKALGAGEDIVRIMTIHKSKGLEFPVVFCINLGGKFSRQGEREGLVLHDRLGMGMPFVDAQLRVKRKTLAQRAILIQGRHEQLAEETRLLYVAMTRAQERLVLMGHMDWQNQLGRWRRMAPGMLLSQADNLLALALVPIMRGLADEPKPMARIQRFELRAIEVEPPVEREYPQAAALLEGMDKTPEGIMGQRLRWRMPQLADSPKLKTSVTSLLEEREAVAPELIPAPDFITQTATTGAQVGSAWHAVLQALPLEAMAAMDEGQQVDSVRRCLEGLTASGVLAVPSALALRPQAIAAFLSTTLGRRLMSAQHVRREWAFNYRRALPEGGIQLVQGVVDCCFQEGQGWILMDYKTDAGPDIEALCDRYAPQLALYAQALEAITGKPVQERWLVFTRHGVQRRV